MFPVTPSRQLERKNFLRKKARSEFFDHWMMINLNSRLLLSTLKLSKMSEIKNQQHFYFGFLTKKNKFNLNLDKNRI